MVAETNTANIIATAKAALTRNAVSGRASIAVSGGIDSIVLLDIADQLKSELRLDLRAVHVHHGLSPNADAWADFCRADCAHRNIPIAIEKITVDRQSGVGIEAAAREARYAALMKEGSPFILTAQHQDDQAETVLHQLLRGTGLNGLAGMGESRTLASGQTLLRPLLSVARRDIEAYANARELKWVEDESNRDTSYARNYLRHELLPVIADRVPHYAESLSRMSQHAAESAELLESLAKVDLQWNGSEAHADALDALPSSRQVNALYHWLRWQNAAPPSREQLEEWARQLFREAPPGKAHNAGGHDYLIRRSRNILMLLPPSAASIK